MGKIKTEILKSNENVKGLHEKVIEHENHLNGIETISMCK